MALTSQQSKSLYGTEAYTAWDENAAREDAKKKRIGINNQSTQSTTGGLGDLMSSMANTMNDIKSLPGQLSSKYNLPALESSAQSSQQALSQLPQNITSQAQRLGSSASQRGLMYGREYEKLAPIAQTSQQQLETARTGYQTELGLLEKSKENELNNLISLYNSGQQLSADQQYKLASLALEEQKLNFEKQKYYEGKGSEGNLLKYLETDNKIKESIPVSDDGFIEDKPYDLSPSDIIPKSRQKTGFESNQLDINKKIPIDLSKINKLGSPPPQIGKPVKFNYGLY